MRVRRLTVFIMVAGSWRKEVEAKAMSSMSSRRSWIALRILQLQFPTSELEMSFRGREKEFCSLASGPKERPTSDHDEIGDGDALA